MNKIVKILETKIPDFSKSVIQVLEEIKGSTSGRSVINLFPERKFGLFDTFEVRWFIGGDYHVELTSTEVINKQSFYDFLLLLFEEYGRSSHGLAFEDFPKEDPFGNESTFWCVDRSGKILERERDYVYCIDILLDNHSSSCTLLIMNAHNIFEK